jgi:hypothetical protein
MPVLQALEMSSGVWDFANQIVEFECQTKTVLRFNHNAVYEENDLTTS